MIDRPLISVIIPTYNTGRFIGQAIDSVLAQTYPHYEIIVVDDGSTDDTKSRLQPFYDKISYHYQPNQGVSAARNTGLTMARGELVLFLDADDYLAPDKLARQSACFDRNAKIGIVHSGWWLVDQAGCTLAEVKPWQNVPQLNLASWLFWKPVYPAAMLFRRSWLERVGGFEPGLAHAEDVDLALRLAQAGCQAKWLKQPTAYYRQHEGNTIHNSRRQAESILYVLDKFFTNPDLPAKIRRREAKVRYYTILWYSWRNRHLPDMAAYLNMALPYVSYPLALTLLEWQAQLRYWQPEAGPEAWNFMIEAAGRPESIRLSDDSSITPQRLLAWGQDMEKNGDYTDLSLAARLELAHFALLVQPDLPTPQDVERLWRGVSADQTYQRTVLNLTAWVRAVVNRQWLLAALFIWPLARDGLQPKAIPAWRYFFRSAYAYYQGRPENL